MGIGSWVDDDGVYVLFLSGMNVFDQCFFMVVLESFEINFDVFGYLG